MAVPKWKMSRSRTRRRRSHDALTIPNWITCKNCNQPTLPHHACRSCGHYKGRMVIDMRAVDVEEDDE